MSLDLEHLHRVHCIGVGGIGVSAAAKFLRLDGKEVTGSDLARSEVTDDAERAGVAVKDEDPENIAPDLDLVIHTSAAREDHPERLAAAALGIPQLSYFEFLGLLSRAHDTVAVAGTNGKSTTTAMLGLILEAAGMDPTVIVGSRVPGFSHGNLRMPSGVRGQRSGVNGRPLLVVEACEHESQMRHLSPKTLVVTNIAADHLDFYHDIDHIKETFQGFAEQLPSNGLLVVNADDENSRHLRAPCRRVSFGTGEAAEYRVEGLRVRPGEQAFDIRAGGGKRLEGLTLRVPGRINVMNALAAAAAASELGAPDEAVRASLAAFPGIWRRFERVGEFRGAPVISDYGHHPDAIRGTLEAAREFHPGRRVILAFQPHQHKRAKKLFDGFVETLAGADVLVLEEIYGAAGRTEGEGEVSSRDLAEAVRARGMKEAWYAQDEDEVIRRLKELVRPDDVVIVMGAGSVYKVANALVR